ncbi:MAG: HpsJ family protein [Cyanobacteria bacterium P01_F01_bin.86]
MSMTVDKPSSSPTVSPLAAISLKLVGGVIIVSSIVDFLILLLPPDLLNSQWQLNVTTQIVDRGIVPLVGIALLLTGFWIERSVGRSKLPSSLLRDLRFWACALASILGFVFLIMTFLHINNVRLAAQGSLANLEQQANDASAETIAQIDEQLAQLEGAQTQQQNQLAQLFQNESLLQQAIDSGQLPDEVLRFKDDPAALDEFLSQRAGEARQQLETMRQERETQIGTRREELRGRIRQEAVKSAARTSISSFLLAIGYVVVGWTGLRRLMNISRA